MTFFLAFAVVVPLGLDTYIPVPDDNPMTREKAALGRALFHDPVLSRNGKISCATCHEHTQGFTDRKALAVGVEGRVGTRRSPALINRAFGKRFFWDGRAKSLEEQATQPIVNPKEMDLSLQEAVQRLQQGKHAGAFLSVFGRDANSEDLARALATYLRTVLSGDSPYDRFVAGDRTALSPAAQQGLRLFRTKAGCVSCHVGFNFTDERLHNTGAGRLDIDQQFKTPTLREVAGRPPYMHDGSLSSLMEVIDFYDKGGGKSPHLDAEIRELHLSGEEKKAVVAFLESLSGRVQEGWPPD